MRRRAPIRRCLKHVKMMRISWPSGGIHGETRGSEFTSVPRHNLSCPLTGCRMSKHIYGAVDGAFRLFNANRTRYGIAKCGHTVHRFMLLAYWCEHNCNTLYISTSAPQAWYISQAEKPERCDAAVLKFCSRGNTCNGAILINLFLCLHYQGFMLRKQITGFSFLRQCLHREFLYWYT